MVTTRSNLQTDDASPSTATKTSPSRSTNGRRSTAMTPTKAKSSTTAAAHSPAPTAPAAWRHSPSNITLLWMAISLPLVIWDTIYVLNRPLTMEGGWMHWPLWVPYQLYGEIDHVYGWPAVEKVYGFTSAQGFLNAIETAMYLAYLWVVFKRGDQGKRVVSGREGATAVLIGFSAAVMTLSKTVLYCTFLCVGLLASRPAGARRVTTVLKTGMQGRTSITATSATSDTTTPSTSSSSGSSQMVLG
jgi:hypothetical protein